MESRFARWALVCLSFLPLASYAQGVEALFDLSSPQGSPFPSDRFSVLEFKNLTYRRVNLPAPDCAVRVSDCQDVELLNTLDGFNLQPRLRVPFSGAIDPASVNSSNMYLVKLGDTTQPLDGYGTVIGVNQIVWDPLTNTLTAEADEFLDQHSVYVFVVTTDVRDAFGARLKPLRFIGGPRGMSIGDFLYRASLLTAVAGAKIPPGRVAAASVFTTRSTTSVLEKIRDQIKASTPAPADFAIAVDGSRSVVSMTTAPNRSLPLGVLSRETAPGVFVSSNLPYALSGTGIPGAISAIAFGRYTSPSYLTPQRYLPAVPTRTGIPQVQSQQTIYFNLVIPSGVKPVNGWPVAISGHGLPGDKDFASIQTSPSLAARGIATLTITTIGNGGGPQGTIHITRNGAPPLVIPSGGRASDPFGLNSYEPTRDVTAPAPRGALSHSDSLRQTAIDLMQLVRVVETSGVDYDGDGISDLDPQRMYYFGHSWGAIYGPIFVAVEPAIRAAVFNSGGGSTGIAAQLSPISRQVAGTVYGARIPSLLNALPFAAPTWGFNSNTPLRNEPTVINDVDGAMALQEVSEINEWVQQGGGTVAYAPHLRKNPLAGMQPRPVIVQFGLGDLNVPNPVTTNFIRAGALADVSTYLRADLLIAADPTQLKNPHSYVLTPFTSAPQWRPYGRALQEQFATFFESDGQTIIDPDGDATIFETPIEGPLPETTNFLP
jgi:hypothetical protein